MVYGVGGISRLVGSLLVGRVASRLGRVNATIRFASYVVMLAAVLAGGLLGQTLGLRGTLVIGSCVAFVAALWLVASPVRTLRMAPVEALAR